MSYRRHYSKYSIENFIISLVVFFLGYKFLTIFVLKQTGVTMAQPTIPAWVWAVIIEIVVVAVAYRIYQLYRLSKAGIYEIDKMTGSEFEEKLSILFSQLGYAVRHTGKTGDYGVDLIIEKEGRKTAVQVKRYGYHEHVPESAIQQAFSGAKFYHCEDAIVVTNSRYTKYAYQLARSIGVSLWNRNDLVNALLTVKSSKPSL